MNTNATAVIAARITAIWLSVISAGHVFTLFERGVHLFDGRRADTLVSFAGALAPAVAGALLWFGARGFAAGVELDELASEGPDDDLDEEDEPSAAAEPTEGHVARATAWLTAGVILIGIWVLAGILPRLLYTLVATALGPEYSFVSGGPYGQRSLWHANQAITIAAQATGAALGIFLIAKRHRIAALVTGTWSDTRPDPFEDDDEYDDEYEDEDE